MASSSPEASRGSAVWPASVRRGALEAAAISRVLTLLSGGRLSAPGAVVLVYHDVQDHPYSSEYCVSTELLRRQLRTLQGWGLRFVAVSRLTTMAMEGEQLAGVGAVSFDDSLVGVYRYALPVLEEMGVPATVFALSRGLGRMPAWLPEPTRLMSIGELREISQAGVCVGSHGRAHVSLPSLNAAQIQEEVAGSRSELEDVLSRPVELFAYPFGHHDPRTRDAVAGAGYRAAYTVSNGRLLAGLDPLRLPRLRVSPRQRGLRLAYEMCLPPSGWPEHQLDAVVQTSHTTVTRQRRSAVRRSGRAGAGTFPPPDMP